MAATLQFLYDLNVTEGVVPPGCDYSRARSLFVSGNAGMVIDGDWSVQGYLQQGLDVGIVPLPEVSETELWPAPLVEARQYMVSHRLIPGTSEWEAVRLFVEFMTGEHAQSVWVEELERLPTNQAVANSAAIQEEPVLAGMVAQLQYAVGRPASPLVSCFWDSTYSSHQDVLAGKLTPENAARRMQENADQCVEASLRPALSGSVQ
jgi:maltose-binding protein MalE